MTTIYLFNQNNHFLEIAQQVILKFEEEHFEVKTFSDYQLLLASVQGCQHIYFMDASFSDSPSEIIGISQKLRSIDPLGKLTFFVPDEEFVLALLASHIEPFSYLCKNRRVSINQFEAFLFETLTSATAAIKNTKEKDYIYFQDGSMRKKVKNSKILYIENFSREKKIKVVTTEESFFVNTYLGSIRNQFDKKIFFVDAQSLIINLTLLNEIQSEKSYLRFHNNLLLPLSPYLLKKVKKAVAS